MRWLIRQTAANHKPQKGLTERFLQLRKIGKLVSWQIAV